MSRWGLIHQHDEEPETVPLWFRFARSMGWLGVVAFTGWSLWTSL